MNRLFRIVAPLLALFTIGVLPAVSQDKPVLPVLSIQQVDAESSDVYAMLIAKNNAAIKEKLGAENYMRVYQGMDAGDHAGAVFVVTAADSFVTLAKNQAAILGDPTLVANRTGFAAVRTLGSRTLWKAERFGGAYPGAFIYNAWVKVSDGPGYSKALDELKAGFDRAGMTDIHLNVYRVIAGFSDSTHLVSFNAPNAERLAALLDSLANDAWVSEWIANSAKYRTLVRTGTYREITK